MHFLFHNKIEIQNQIIKEKNRSLNRIVINNPIKIYHNKAKQKYNQNLPYNRMKIFLFVSN